MARNRSASAASQQSGDQAPANGPKTVFYDVLWDFADDEPGAVVARQDAADIASKYRREFKDALRKLTENA